MSPDSFDATATAERLKIEGNAFHQARELDKAYAKYTEAIKLDPLNPKLWANRAATGLAMKKYLDACTDTEKAVELDPTYTKAWGRQGAAYLALGNHCKSANAFKQALNCLSAAGELSEADQFLKAHYEDGLKKTEKNIRRECGYVTRSTTSDDFPWKRAMAMEPILVAEKRVQHSGFVILFAYREFMEAMEVMNLIRTQEVNLKGREVVFSKNGVIDMLSNTVLLDRRAFHITDGDFINKYNKQILFEAHNVKAWTDGGPSELQEEAVRRLETSGWDKVRPALSVTIRAWIISGCLQAIFEQPASSAEFIADALQVLTWGARLWKDVPRNKRGVIFEDSFIQAVKRLYANLLFESYTQKGWGDFEEIGKVAHEIINEELLPPEDNVEPSFVSAFWVYPVADAHVILGWYYLQKAKAATTYNEGIELCKVSATHYFEGATLFPPDDEKHVMFLKACLEAHWYAQSPLKITLPIAKRMREAVPKMKEIWEHSADAEVRDEGIDMVRGFEDHFEAEIAAGRKTLESSGGLEGFELRLVNPSDTSINSEITVISQREQ